MCLVAEVAVSDRSVTNAASKFSSANVSLLNGKCQV